tara:strand:- start:137 stop:475 length:339 start_codon:yes stop_codon:yes gene_type:complete
MSDLIDKINKKAGSVTAKDILIANILHYTSTDDIAEELNNRISGNTCSDKFKSMQNILLIDELTSRLANMGTILTTATMLDEMGKSVSNPDFFNNSFFGEISSHVSSSWSKF